MDNTIKKIRAVLLVIQVVKLVRAKINARLALTHYINLQVINVYQYVGMEKLLVHKKCVMILI